MGERSIDERLAIIETKLDAIQHSLNTNGKCFEKQREACEARWSRIERSIRLIVLVIAVMIAASIGPAGLKILVGWLS